MNKLLAVAGLTFLSGCSTLNHKAVPTYVNPQALCETELTQIQQASSENYTTKLVLEYLDSTQEFTAVATMIQRVHDKLPSGMATKFVDNSKEVFAIAFDYHCTDTRTVESAAFLATYQTQEYVIEVVERIIEAQEENERSNRTQL